MQWFARTPIQIRAFFRWYEPDQVQRVFLSRFLRHPAPSVCSYAIVDEKNCQIEYALKSKLELGFVYNSLAFMMSILHIKHIMLN